MERVDGLVDMKIKELLSDEGFVARRSAAETSW
jgi:hypothetical protein